MATSYTFATTQGDKTYAQIVAANATLSTNRQTRRTTLHNEAVARDQAGGIALTHI